MLQNPVNRVIHFTLVISLVLGLSSCVVYDRPYGPRYAPYAAPPSASVSYYDYWYYPDAQVYFDTNRRVYFYFSNQRWVETRVLPSYWRDRLHGYVPIHSRHQRPYLEYQEHNRKYPPRYREEHRERERDNERYAPRYRNNVYPRDYQEVPRKEPPRTWRQLLEQDGHDNRVRQQPDSDVKSPVRQQYHESPRKEPPRTWQQLLEQNGRDNRARQQPDTDVKTPVRQRYHESPRKEPVKNVKQKAYEKEKAKDQKHSRHNKGKDNGRDQDNKSRRSKDEDQQDDQYLERRDYR